MLPKPNPISSTPGKGATYTITSTTSGYGGWHSIDTLPKQLISLHTSLFPSTPRQDVTAIENGFQNAQIQTGGSDARLLKVLIEIRQNAWTAAEKRLLIERVHAHLVKWKGTKAEKTDIVVQVTEIEDWNCVMRNGRWGMWEGVVPSSAAGNGEDGDGRSVATVESERTLVGRPGQGRDSMHS